MARYSALTHKLKTLAKSLDEQLAARRFTHLPYVCIDLETGADLPGYEIHNDEARKHKFCKEYGFDVAEIGTEP